MRSLVVFHIGGVGGPQRSLPQVVGWLRSHGEVEFLVPEEGPTADEYREYGPVEVRDYSRLTYARGAREAALLVRDSVRQVRMFRRELRRRRPDVVVAVTTVLPALVLAARMERVPCVVYAAELYEQEWKAAPLLRVWGALLSALTARLSAGIVGCSDIVVRQLARWSRRPLAVAYPPIGEEYAGGDRERGRAAHGIGSEETCLFVAGSVSRGRGQDVALRALPLIHARFPGARLVVLGDPHQRAADIAFAEELRALARELGVAREVVFAGSAVGGATVAQMADAYAAADVVVNPARFAEPFGRVAPEALVAGTPVVATCLGGIPEVIRDGIDGLLVAPEDPDALARAVIQLLEQPELARALVESGRRRVLERFGYEQDLAAWRRVLDPLRPATIFRAGD